MLTIEQKAFLANLAEHGQSVKAIEMCIEACEDYLVTKLLARGGYGTLQLNEPNVQPRIQFVEPKLARPVNKAKIGGVLVERETAKG